MEVNHLCIICNNKIPEDKHWKTCSKECRIKLINEIKKKKWASGEIINWTDKRFRTPNVEEKMQQRNKNVSKTRKQKFATGEIVNWTDKSIRTDESQQKIDDLNIKRVITGRKNGMFDWDDKRKLEQKEKLIKSYQSIDLRKKMSKITKKLMTPEMKKRISKTICESIISGKFNQQVQKGYKHGYYESIKGSKNNGNKKLFYRSSLELKWFQYLDQNFNIEKWFYESLRVPLLDNLHHTVVDLDVYYTNGTRKIVEMKPKKLVSYVKNRIEAAKKYCIENNLHFEIWTENEMIPIC